MWYGIAGILSILLSWQQGLMTTNELIAMGLLGGIPGVVILSFCYACERSDRRTMAVYKRRG